MGGVDGTGAGAAPVTTGGVGRRERKKQATRAAMQAAALALFAERGVAGVTVEEIAEAADVAPSTFFRHFPTKEDAVLVGLVERWDDLLAALAAQPRNLPLRDALLGAVDAWALDRRDPEVLAAELTLLAAEPALMNRLDRVMIDIEPRFAALMAPRLRVGGTSVEARLHAAWFVAAIRVALLGWLTSGADEDVFAFGRRLFERHWPRS